MNICTKNTNNDRPIDVRLAVGYGVVSSVKVLNCWSTQFTAVSAISVQPVQQSLYNRL